MTTSFLRGLLLGGLFACCSVLYAVSSSAQNGPPDTGVVIFSDSFETGIGNWSQDSQSDWFSSTQRAIDGSRSAEVDGWATNAALISPVVDLQGAATAWVSFSWQIERWVDGGEYLAFDISTNEGNTWVEQARLSGNVDTENTWHQATLEVSNADTLSLRFRGLMSRSNEDANIDDVRVVVDSADPVDHEPTVDLAAPVDGSTVGGFVSIAVDASDDGNVTGVNFFIDGNLVFSDPSAPYELVWDSAAEFDGAHSITVTATDDAGQTATTSISVSVENIAVPPTITSSPVTNAVEGSSYSYLVTATDPNSNDSITFTITDGPIDISVDSVTGQVQWVPDFDDVGTHFVEVTVMDSGGLSDSQGFNLEVAAAPSESVVFSDSFESGFGAWQQDSQNDWFRSTQRASNGGSAAEIDGWATDAKLTSPSIDLQGYADAAIEFSWYIESSVDSGEYIAFDVSINEGSSWTEMARLRGNSDAENTWHAEYIQLADISSLDIRFRGRMSRSNEDANVDDVIVTASGTGGDPEPPIDLIAPTISIVSPSSSGSYQTAAGSVSVSGLASDNVGLTDVTWRSNGGASSSATGLQNWEAADIVLAPGDNTIEVTASDAAGNTESAQIVVSREQHPLAVLQGIAILGDSNSDEYRADDDRGGAYSQTTLNWMEQLVSYRGLNFGAWGNRSQPRRSGYAYNWALSGATASSMISGGQHSGVAQQVSAGEVSLVFIHIGTNDFARNRYSEIYNGNLSGQNLDNKIQGIIQDITHAVDTIQAAGSVNILLTDCYDYSLPAGELLSDYPDATRRQKVTDAIQVVNAGLHTMAQQRGVAIVDMTAAFANILSGANSNGILSVGGEQIDLTRSGDEPHFGRLGDSYGHPGTILSGILFANGIFIENVNNAFGTSLAPLTDNELLQAAGIVP